MESIGSFIVPPRKADKKTESMVWIRACEIAKWIGNGEKPHRWLRAVKQHPWAIDRTLSFLKDKGDIKNRGAIFTYWFKKFKEEA